MTNPLVYVPAQVPKECVFKISPSRFGTFVQYPWRWAQSEILGKDVFEYNTSSVLGTVVHYCAKQVALEEMVDKKDIEEYIDMHKPKDDYDPAEVRAQYQKMAETLVNDYVLSAAQDFLGVEMPVAVHLRDNYYAAGTLDALQGTKEDCILVDYKTYNSKTEPKSIPPDYRYQLLTYAYLLRMLGYNVTRIRNVFINRNIDGGISEKTGKPLKSYPPKVTVLTETITEEDYDFIESLLELCVDSLEATEQYPELRHVIFHDPRLRVE